MWLPLKDGGATRHGRTNVISLMLSQLFWRRRTAMRTKTCGNSPTMGPSIGQRGTALLLSRSPPRFFFPSFFRLPRQIFLAFPSLACIVPFLSVSPEGIVLASIPASSFPPSLASPRTTDPFPCKLYVKWRTFIPAARTHRNTPYKTREHPSPLPHVHTALMGVKREFWLAGCSSVPLPPLTDRLGEKEERGDGGH